MNITTLKNLAVLHIIRVVVKEPRGEKSFRVYSSHKKYV